MRYKTYILRDFDNKFIKDEPKTDEIVAVRYGAKVRKLEDFDDPTKVWHAVYFNNIYAAYNFANFIKARFGHVWIKREEEVPDMFYDSLENLLLGVYWKYNDAKNRYFQYKNVKCCFEPLSKEEFKKGPSK